MVSSDEPVALDTATSVRRRLAPDIAKVAGATDMSCRSEAWRGGGGEAAREGLSQQADQHLGGTCKLPPRR